MIQKAKLLGVNKSAILLGIIFLPSGSKNKSAKGLNSFKDWVLKYKDSVNLLGYLESALVYSLGSSTLKPSSEINLCKYNKYSLFF